MDITCQYCGTVAADRVMCPNCRRRMQPAGSDPATPPAAYPAQPPAYPGPPPASPVPAADSTPPSSGYGVPPTRGPWGGPLKPAVLFDRAATVKISRPSVGFRLILAIPVVVLVAAMQIAALFVTIVAWFAAVFTARVPVGMYNFTSYVAAYNTRLTAYVCLIVDKWPTLSSDDPYPVVVRFPGPERLNRAAVIFRLVLLIPAAIVTNIVQYGIAVLAFPFWLIILIAGRVPEPIFNCQTAAVRYQTRVLAYYLLLTSAYPAGLFGDGVEAADHPGPHRAELEAPRTSTGGKRLLVVLIIAGVAGSTVYSLFVAVPPIRSLVRQFVAEDKLSSAYDKVHLDAQSSCAAGPGQLNCLQAFDANELSQVRQFDATVAGIDFPSDAAGEELALRLQTGALIDEYTRLLNAQSFPDYQRVETVLPTAIQQFEEAENALDDYLLGN